MGSLLLSEPTLASRFERKKKKKRKGEKEGEVEKEGEGGEKGGKKRAHSCSFSFENWQRNIYTLEEDTRAAFS